MTLNLQESQAKGVATIGRLMWDGVTLSFDGIGKEWYDTTMAEDSEAPQAIPAFLKWADMRFRGNYFWCEFA